jgi:hypothetical protein
MTIPPQTSEELSFNTWLATDAEPQKLIRSIVDHIATSIDYALRRGGESSGDPSLLWLAEVMRHAPPPEHAAAYGAFMLTVRDLMQQRAASTSMVDAQILAEAQREIEALKQEIAAVVEASRAVRQE